MGKSAHPFQNAGSYNIARVPDKVERRWGPRLSGQLRRCLLRIQCHDGGDFSHSGK